GSPVRQEKLVIHLGSVAARIKDRKCMTIGGLQSHLSSAGWFKVLLLPELLTRKLSPRKMTLPFSPFSMMMKRGHLDNQLDVELLNLNDRCHARQEVMDNAVNCSARELMSFWKAFEGNTRDLGSFGEETDKTTDLHQHLSRISTQRLKTASQNTRDAVTNPTMTVSQHFTAMLARTTQPKI
ncbi:hypothetical protein Tco_0048225, partial [Tanacetum coccineum]